MRSRRFLTAQLPKLQAELVERVLAELPAAPAQTGAGSPIPDGPAHGSNLVQAVASIHAGTTQKEILRALLDAGSAYGSRIALFVVKAGSATGWQGRGLGDDDAVKDFPLDMTSGPAAHAYQNRIVAPANIAEMDRRFVKQFGGPENEQIMVLPLVLKDKVAALLYADGGTEGVLDGPVARSSCDGHQRVAGSDLAAQASAERCERRRTQHGARARCGARADGQFFFRSFRLRILRNISRRKLRLSRNQLRK